MTLARVAPPADPEVLEVEVEELPRGWQLRPLAVPVLVAIAVRILALRR